MAKYIDAEKLKADIEKSTPDELEFRAYRDFIIALIESLQQEIPDKETILRICKLHKAWSIMAPWDNVEDFVTTNWNSENIV